jgi:hypothetical protein
VKHNQGNGQQKDEMKKMREFAYRAPSPDSEPPTMQETEESSETEGPATPPPAGMQEAEERDLSPDDFEEGDEKEKSGRQSA